MGYSQLVSAPTRRGSTVSNILDLVIVDSLSPSVLLSSVSVSDVCYSDHSLVVFELVSLRPIAPLVTSSKRAFSNFDPVRFMSLLCTKSICISPPDTADKFVKQLDLDVTDVLDVTAPIQTYTRRASVRPRSNWITPAARDAKRYARSLQRIFHRSQSESDYINWRRAGRIAVREMKTARAKFLSDSIQAELKIQGLYGR